MVQPERDVIDLGKPDVPGPKVLTRVARYQVVNVGTFAGDIFLVWLLTSMLGFHYLHSVTLGFIAAVTAGFLLNRWWTFAKDVHIGRIAVALLVAVLTLAVIASVTYAGVEGAGLNYLVARLIAALVAAMWSYFGDSLFTFDVPPLR